MTVVYADMMASQGNFGAFWRLLVRWRGSIYKMVWQDMMVYLTVYYIISMTYRFGLDEEQRTTFEEIVMHCTKFKNLIPVSFVLGFFVSLVVSRWWGVYQSVPWPDTTAILVATHIPGQDEKSRNVRQTVLRYVNLTIAMTFSMVSPVVKKRLPNLIFLMNEGYLTPDEVRILENLEKTNTRHKTWVPIMWTCKILQKAREEELIKSDLSQKTIENEVLKVRGNCGALLGWNEYNIPLVYTQVVTIAVYIFFLFSIIGEQFLDPTKNYEDHVIDMYFPIFAFLQLFFYVGWLKVGEALLNPFGEDDHDFEFCPMLDRHREMSAMLSDTKPSELPNTVIDPKERQQLESQIPKRESNGSAISNMVNPDNMSPVEAVITPDGAAYFKCQINGT